MHVGTQIVSYIFGHLIPATRYDCKLNWAESWAAKGESISMIVSAAPDRHFEDILFNTGVSPISVQTMLAQ